MIIAIDGPSGSGKGTLAKALAEHYQLAHLDTGLLYRAVGYKLLKNKHDLSDVEAATEAACSLHTGDLNDPALKSEEVALAASKVATYPSVRQALVDFQRSFAKHPPAHFHGALLDGRDIGTYILPNADFKFYVTADLETRAQRRFKELQQLGIESIYTEVLKTMRERDLRDSERIENPLKPASDAYILDTTQLSTHDMVKHAVKYIDLTLQRQRDKTSLPQQPSS